MSSLLQGHHVTLFCVNSSQPGTVKTPTSSPNKFNKGNNLLSHPLFCSFSSSNTPQEVWFCQAFPHESKKRRKVASIRRTASHPSVGVVLTSSLPSWCRDSKPHLWQITLVSLRFTLIMLSWEIKLAFIPRDAWSRFTEATAIKSFRQFPWQSSGFLVLVVNFRDLVTDLLSSCAIYSPSQNILLTNNSGSISRNSTQSRGWTPHCL